jgi:arylsulfatase A-like enzyme
MSFLRIALLIVVAGLGVSGLPTFAANSEQARPNVVFILSDDMGYGELSCHGNPILKTPNIDKLHSRSVRFTNFQVSPTCSPTRAALMTGRHEFRSGVTHTLQERERLALSAVTLPSVLAAAGYQTGIFGKWHLGDEWAYRPAQRGFTESFIHGAGGIGQSYEGSCGDFPGNSYFDPVVLHNERVEQTHGYCTDVFFEAALGWIKANRDQPFFAYIATNAPHGPFICPEEDSRPYEQAGLDERSAAFYGMIANLDTNVGRLLDQLERLGLTRNTLVIFMTDNGHVIRKLYNAGLRGHKNSPYDGGTRVPAFFSWPGALPEGVDVPTLAAHIDILPTLAALCGATVPPEAKVEGRSLVPLLRDANAPMEDRYLFTHCGRWERGAAASAKYHDCAVRNQRFKLVNHSELYDLQNDPGEQRDVSDQYPEVVAELQKAYDTWWDDVQADLVNETAPLAPRNSFALLLESQGGDLKRDRNNDAEN